MKNSLVQTGLAALALGVPGGVAAQEAPFTVCIDPGHSKKTVGTTGKRSAEYKVAWRIALRLQETLERNGVKVVLTKPDADANITNQRRAEIANEAKAGLFLRLHCDAGRSSGFATYYPDRQGVFGKTRGPSQEVLTQSRRAAFLFHPALARTLGGALKDNGIKTDMKTQVGRRHKGALEGSIFSQVPVVLVEMCVLQNPKDERFILSERGQNLMAQALAAGALAVKRTKR